MSYYLGIIFSSFLVVLCVMGITVWESFCDFKGGDNLAFQGGLGRLNGYGYHFNPPQFPDRGEGTVSQECQLSFCVEKCGIGDLGLQKSYTIAH